MPKTTTHYVCQGCGHESPRWLGRCPECDAWNSFVEEVRVPEKAAAPGRAAGAPLPAGMARPVPITRVEATAGQRLPTGIGELDRVLGGGVVPGAVILVGGDPGIGKSTLMTQAAHEVARAGGAPTLYASGEESAAQIKLRAERLGAQSDGFLVVNETDVNLIAHQVEAERPSLVVVDSIQTAYDPALESAPGTVSQVRNAAAVLSHVAKGSGIAVFLIGHVTKEGALAGPRVLEHMVDTVLYFEGDRHMAYRILRAVKNRFGSTDEIGIFEMGDTGLTEVSNPSAALLAERREDSTGSTVAATLEGTRPLLVEVQALVARSYLGIPRRAATGIDVNRLNMLLAVLEKRVGLRLGDQDVYVNVAGGIRIVEPAADLGIAIAVASSFREEPADPHALLLGEVGLGGEVRAVAQVEKRLREAARLGFSRAVVARHQVPRAPGMDIVRVSTVSEAMSAVLLPAVA